MNNLSFERKVFLFLILLCCHLWIRPVYAADFVGELHQLTMKDGLADNIITAIYKDRDGFMWFGSANGLSKYDGTQIKNYNGKDQRISVHSIKETTDNILWIQSGPKLCCFTREIEQFVPLPLNDCTQSIVDFQIMNDSIFWILSVHDLLCVKRHDTVNEEGKLINVDFTIEKKISDIIVDNKFARFCYSADRNRLLLITENAHLFIYDIASSKVILNKKLLLTSKEIVTSILSNEENYIWVSTFYEGVFRFHIPTGQVEQFVYGEDSKLSSLSHKDAYNMVAVGQHSYVIATWNGLTYIHPAGDGSSKMIPQIYDNSSFQRYRNLETRMISCFYDSRGILWIGTRGGGVLYFDQREQFYKQCNFQHSNEIVTQMDDDEQYIWLGTYHEGIMRSDKPFRWGDPLRFTSLYNKGDKPISSATKDANHNLWFGNSDGELIYYDTKTKQFSTYPLMLNKKRLNVDVTALLIDSKERFWVGTVGGIYLFDRKSGMCTQITLCLSKEGELSEFSAIREDRMHRIWLGTKKGVFRMDGNNLNVVKGFNETGGRKNRQVKSLLEASDGTLYIGYKRGLGIIPEGKEQITDFYTMDNGLCNDCINCMVEDNKGDIWLGNISGISRYSKNQRLFYNYYISGSISSVLFLDHTLFWGNNKSLTYFQSENVGTYPKSEKVAITGLNINNKSVDIDELVNGQKVLNKNIAYLDEIKLKFKNRDFSLLFNNLTYSKEKQKYSYRLRPYQDQWLLTENGRASYTNLSSGNYIFEVRPVYPDNGYGEVASMRMMILPHWSQTCWFRFLVFLSVLGVLGYIIYWFLQRQRNFERIMNLKHELSLASAERDNEKLIREEKENFFTTAAHELRTPLTLILSPLQGILNNMPITDKLYTSLSSVNRNCLSLKTLVDGLLYVRKIEAGMVKLRLSEVDIVKIVREQATHFLQIAMANDCEFTLKLEVDVFMLWMDVEKIEACIGNLLSNAFKYTPEKGKIELSLSKEVIDGKGYAVITVNDNGIGIAKQDQKNIFTAFATSGCVRQPAGTSVGIGLYIVKNTLDLHHGFIKVESCIGEGSRFIIYIPEGKEHFIKDNFEYVDYQPKKTSDPSEKCIPAPLVSLNTADNKLEKESKKEKRYTMLIIEDNKDVRFYIRTIFKDEYTVLESINGEEGVRSAEENIPDLIISDVMMPVMDGFECCMRIKANPKTGHIPIIMLTAKAEDGDRIEGLKLGVDDYMMKPFNPEILIERVKNLLKQREQLKRFYTQTLGLKPTSKKKKENDAFMQEVIHIIEENLENENFSVKVLTDKLCMSQPTLYRQIKQRTNLSILEVIQGVRMTKAAALILERKYTLLDVASRVGFDSLTAFRKHFVAQFGVLPSKYEGNAEEEENSN